MQRTAFVCEGNAGRSQLATALAEREIEERGLDADIVTGGVDPSDHVHPEVVEVLDEMDIDISDREPRQIQPEDVADCSHIVTMGCDASEFAPDGWDGESRRWQLDHPGGDSIEEVRDQRDEVHRRVRELFDKIA